MATKKIRDRTKRARRAVEAYKTDAYGVVQGEFEEDKTAITDLITDLLHLTQRNGDDPAWRLECAMDHFRKEARL